MNFKQALARLPDTDKKVVVSHSGGLDSSTALILAVEKYGKNKVISVGYDYGQKQVIETQKAQELCEILGIERHVIDLRVLGDIVRTRSANIAGTNIEMPSGEDVEGNHSQPSTYVPWRNGILFMMTAAFAEVHKASHIICGLQLHDHYGYFDTTQSFVDNINSLWDLNPEWKIKLIAPFSHMSKKEELEVCISLNKLHLMEHTITCYNPSIDGKSCGKCPSCFERLKAFKELNLNDLVDYIKE